MPQRIPQSIALRVPLKAYLASDHVSDATGKTLAVTISKNGAAFGNPSVGATNAAEIGNGWYYVDLSTTDGGTIGPLVIRAAVATVDSVEIVYQVVDANTLGAAALPSVVAGASGGLPLSVDSSGRVDVLKINGTSQTARDIGASVLLSTGSGTGQLDFTSGVVKANLAQILGTALTETAGLIAAAFKQFFNVATPTGTVNLLPRVTLTDTATTVTNRVTANADQFGGQTVTAAAGVTMPSSVASPTNITAATGIVLSAVTHTGAVLPRVTLTDTVTTYTGDTPQTGDAYARVGLAGAGLTALGDTRIANLDAAVTSRTKPADTQAAVTLVTTNNDKTGYSLTVTPPTAAAISTAVWAETSRTLSSFGTLVADAATAVWAAATRTLSAFGFTVATSSDSNVTAIKAKTDLIPAAPAAVGDIPTASDIASAVGARVPTESYAADGAAPTNDQFAYMIWAVLAQFAITAATISVKKLDGSTEAMVFTMDDATTPTSRTRTT